jgi:adenylate cyclase
LANDERRLAAIVSADVVGYSRLMGVDESATLDALRGHRSALIDPKIAEHGGRIVKTMGDGLLLEFPSVVNAVKCSIAAQDGMLERNAEVPDETRITFRIGVNLGDIIVDGEDILGDGVNIAARLQEIAEPGGICLSARVHDDVRDRIDAEFSDLGERELKNIARPVHCWAWRGSAPAGKVAPNTSQFMAAPALAVLPFNNLSQDTEFEYFADGLAEDLTTLLSAFRAFPVIARNSSFTFKGRNIDIADAGRQLGAKYIVEGSVRVAGNRMRVNAQLIDVETGHHLWAQKFDRDVEDIFTLQDELSLQIAANISPTVGRNEAARAGKASEQDLSLWAKLSAARQMIVSTDYDNVLRARGILQGLEKQNPENSMIHAQLAYCAIICAFAGFEPWREARVEIMRHARRAIDLDPTNPLAYTALSTAESYHGHLETALQASDRAVELNPSDGSGYRSRAICLVMMGRAAEALPDLAIDKRLSPLDPDLPMHHLQMSRAMFFLCRYDESVDAARQCLADVPDFPPAWLQLIAALAQSGRVERAQSEGQAFQTRFPDADMPGLLVNFTTRDPKDRENFNEGLRKVGLIDG